MTERRVCSEPIRSHAPQPSGNDDLREGGE